MDEGERELPDHILRVGVIAEYRMAAIFRADLPLPPGKIAAQAGHAFLTAWRASRAAWPEIAEDYALYGQAKMILLAPDLPSLHRILARATARGVPTALIADAGRTEVPASTVTVLGLGPMTRTDYNALTRGLALMP